MQKHQQDLKQYSQHATNVLAWLQTINKTTRPSPRQHLEQQLQTLSLSYKNAQQKLLSLQKQIYYESLHNQKQRSIIQILKYIINGSLDDQTILTYLAQMQDQANGSYHGNVNEDGKGKYEIKRQLQEIKQIVLKRKMDGKKAESLKCVAMADMKKQIIKCNQIKKQLMQDLDRTLNEKGQLQSTIQQLKSQLKFQASQKNKLQTQLQVIQQNFHNVAQQNKQKQQQLIKANKLNQLNQQYFTKIKQQLNKISNISQDKHQQPKDIIKQIIKLQDKLQKYKNMCRQLSQKINTNTRNKQLMDVLKIFLPQDAIKIYEQYQKSGQKCLLKQIQGIGRLQRKKYSQLEGCQQEVWRLKQKLLRQGSWLQSKRTGATNSQQKQNMNPNVHLKVQHKISQFQIEPIEVGRNNQL